MNVTTGERYRHDSRCAVAGAAASDWQRAIGSILVMRFLLSPILFHTYASFRGARGIVGYPRFVFLGLSLG